MPTYDIELSREVEGWTIKLNINATPEDALSFIRQLNGLYGPVAPVRQQYAQQPQRPAQQQGNDAPLCPKHGTPMAPSKFGGFYCREKDPSAEKGYCIEKVK